jgi:hypothetical protein
VSSVTSTAGRCYRRDRPYAGGAGLAEPRTRDAYRAYTVNRTVPRAIRNRMLRPPPVGRGHGRGRGPCACAPGVPTPVARGAARVGVSRTHYQAIRLTIRLYAVCPGQSGSFRGTAVVRRGPGRSTVACSICDYVYFRVHSSSLTAHSRVSTLVCVPGSRVPCGQGQRSLATWVLAWALAC